MVFAARVGECGHYNPFRRSGRKIDEEALKGLIRAAMALNLKSKPKPGERAASG
jgi:hypothetical protein